MDEDGNKKLNLEEFKTGLKQIELELSDEEIEEIFRKFDTDEDGNISVDEFLVGIRVSFFIWSNVCFGVILFDISVVLEQKSHNYIFIDPYFTY